MSWRRGRTRSGRRSEVRAAGAHQLELALDVAERLLEDLAATALVRVALEPLGAQRGARLLGLEQRLELVEAEAEQLLEAQGVAEALDVGLVVCAVTARL